MKTNISKHTRTSRIRGFLFALTGVALLMAAESPAFHRFPIPGTLAAGPHTLAIFRA